MQITLVGEGPLLEQLELRVRQSLLQIGATETVGLTCTNDPSYKLELGITQNPALCIEETSIDFKDVIFEGVVPDASEIDGMFISLLGTEIGGGCSTGGSCGTCSTGGCDSCDD